MSKNYFSTFCDSSNTDYTIFITSNNSLDDLRKDECLAASYVMPLAGDLNFTDKNETICHICTPPNY